MATAGRRAAGASGLFITRAPGVLALWHTSPSGTRCSGAVFYQRMVQTAGLPLVTLVVAMRNEAASIERCLASIAAQDYPPGLLEVLVYDGESDDGSAALAEAFAAGRERWSVRQNPRRIQAAAWNAGIAAARGDIVGIVCGHAEIAPSYVSSAVSALERTGADMVGGPVHAIGEGAVGQAIAIASSTPFGVGGARHHYVVEAEDVDTVFMGLCRRETYLRFPFDESMVRNQDDELSYRLLDAGGRIVCDPTIQSVYRNRSSLSGLWRQHFDYGRWKVLVLRAHPGQVRPRHVVPVVLVTTLAAGAVLAPISRTVRTLLIAELGLYAAATGVAAVRYGSGRPLRAAALLAAVYPVLHLSYGTGMLRGFWQFRWQRRGTPTGVAAQESQTER
jgi:succinoglycan biosynthesis protein ExoA